MAKSASLQPDGKKSVKEGPAQGIPQEGGSDKDQVIRKATVRFRPPLCQTAVSRKLSTLVDRWSIESTTEINELMGNLIPPGSEE